VDASRLFVSVVKKDNVNDGVIQHSGRMSKSPCCGEVADANRLFGFQKRMPTAMETMEVQDSWTNCPAVANPGQEDRDGDGLGVYCDTVSWNASQAFTPMGRNKRYLGDFQYEKRIPNSLVRGVQTLGKEVFSARN